MDTRKITRMIRDEGAMNAVICSDTSQFSELDVHLSSLPDMNGLDLARKVSCIQAYKLSSLNANSELRIAVVDFGIKLNILRILQGLDCDIKVFPAMVTSQKILEYNPDGVFLSNGPGDPKACSYAIKTVKELLGKKPIFGICLGHQILSTLIG